MPQYIWEDIFSILNVLVPGVIMALFAAYYQNRRKWEIKIEGQLAIERIDGYEQILSLFYDAQNLQNATLEEAKKAEAILGYFNVKTFHCEYPNALNDEACFDEFYCRLKNLQRDYQIYLDDKVSRQLDRSLAVYTHFKKWMDAFCDTEHTVDLGLSVKQAQDHIDWMYKLLGMVMFSHCTRAYVELENLICKQLKHFSLTYRRHRARRAVRRVKEKVMCYLDRCARMPNIRGRFCHMLLILSFDKEYRNFMLVMKEVPKMMCYVHFSDRYSPQDYFKLKRIPSSEELQLFGEVFMAQMHRS